MAARLRAGTGRAAGGASFRPGTGYAAPVRPRPTSTVAAPAAGPSAQAAPPDPTLIGQINAAQLNYAQQTGANEYQRGQLGNTYGLRGDAQGGVFDDPSNPYSRAAALQESYDNSKRGNTNSYAARGQLYSGALQNAQNTSAEGFNKGRASLVSEFLGRQAALAQSDLAARNGLESDALGAQSASLSRAQAAANNAPPELSAPAPASGPRPAAAKGYTDKPGKDSKGNKGIWRVHTNGRKVFIRG